MKKMLLTLVVAATASVSVVANANTVRLPWFKLNQTIVDSANFGGCMARTPSFAEIAPSCGDRFVVFSCSGELQDADSAGRLFDIAQIAMATGKEVQFHVDTTKKHNGFCMAVRADIR